MVKRLSAEWKGEKLKKKVQEDRALSQRKSKTSERNSLAIEYGGEKVYSSDKTSCNTGEGDSSVYLKYLYGLHYSSV